MFVAHDIAPNVRGGRPLEREYIGIDFHKAFFQEMCDQLNRRAAVGSSDG